MTFAFMVERSLDAGTPELILVLENRDWEIRAVVVYDFPQISD